MINKNKKDLKKELKRIKQRISSEYDVTIDPKKIEKTLSLLLNKIVRVETSPESGFYASYEGKLKKLDILGKMKNLNTIDYTISANDSSFIDFNYKNVIKIIKNKKKSKFSAKPLIIVGKKLK